MGGERQVQDENDAISAFRHCTHARIVRIGIQLAEQRDPGCLLRRC